MDNSLIQIKTLPYCTLTKPIILISLVPRQRGQPFYSGICTLTLSQSTKYACYHFWCNKINRFCFEYIHLKLDLSHGCYGLFVSKLRGNPGKSPFEVGQHELECLGPLLLRVELNSENKECK